VIADALVRKGFAVLRFDFTGLGQSEGEFVETNFSTNVSDLVAAAEYLAAEHEAPAVLVGHSLGGTAVLAAAPEIASSKAVVTINAPAEAKHILHLLGDSRDRLEAEGRATVDIGGTPFEIRKQFLDDVEQQELPASVRRLRRALLVMHSPVDAIVTIDNATEIFTHALHPKSFISLDDADHLLSREADAIYAGDALAAWASRYVTVTAEKDESDAAAEAAVARTGSEGFLTELVAGGHPLLADEPASVGGANAGPSPYALLSAALATCTSMTLQMYARHKGIALESATVSVTHEKIHARDCESCETREGKIDQFARTIELHGDLTDDMRARMLEIADKCPVHRTLNGEIEIVTSAAG
jgi:putative redox protein